MLFLLLILLLNANCFSMQKNKLTVFVGNSTEAIEVFPLEWEDQADKTMFIQFSNADYDLIKTRKNFDNLVLRRAHDTGTRCDRLVNGKQQSFNVAFLLQAILPRTEQTNKFDAEKFEELDQLRKLNGGFYKKLCRILGCGLVGFAGLSACLWWKK